MKKASTSIRIANAAQRRERDSMVGERRRSEMAVAFLKERVQQLENAIEEAKRTSRQIAQSTLDQCKAQNAHASEREQMVAGLQHTQAALLQRIDDDTAELASSAIRMRELSAALVLAHEEEQRRIARELHDQIGQDLTALKMLITRGKNGTMENARAVFQEAEAFTEEILQTVRTICSSLRPQVLDDLGLIAGIQWHIKTFSERVGLDVTLDMEPIDESRLSPLVKSTIFRVIQEALTNLSRHAETKTASVMLTMRKGFLEFSVRDGGKGFDSNDTAKTHSTGIAGMRERLSLVGGVFELASFPGQGTIIKAQIPVPLDPPNHSQSNRNRTNHGKSPTDQSRDSRRPSPRPKRTEVSAGK